MIRALAKCCFISVLWVVLLIFNHMCDFIRIVFSHIKKTNNIGIVKIILGIVQYVLYWMDKGRVIKIDKRTNI